MCFYLSHELPCTPLPLLTMTIRIDIEAAILQGEKNRTRQLVMCQPNRDSGNAFKPSLILTVYQMSGKANPQMKTKEKFFFHIA